MAFLDRALWILGLELRDAHGLDFRDGLGFYPHFRGSFNFIYNFYYKDSVPLSKSGVLGFNSLNKYNEVVMIKFQY